MGHRQPRRIRGGLQGRHTRGRHKGRRRHKGPGLLLPNRRDAKVLRRGQEAVGRHRPRHLPRVSTQALRMVGKAAAVDPDRLRGVRRLRLPHPTQTGRQGLNRTNHVLHVRQLRREVGRNRIDIRQAGGPPGLVRQVRDKPQKTRDRRSRRRVPQGNRELAHDPGPQYRAAEPRPGRARDQLQFRNSRNSPEFRRA